MTTDERIYYDQLSPITNTSDWSNIQLLSVSMLDGTLGIINFIQNFHTKTNTTSNQWQETLNAIREETKNRWILDEKIVLNRLNEKDSTCISKTTMAKRRSYFEERVEFFFFCLIKNELFCKKLF